MNPVTELRTRRGWTMRQLALALGVRYGLVWEVEQGHPRTLPQAVREGLARLGADADHVAEEYLRWRKAAGDALCRS